MRYFKLTIAYDGTDFHGWQIQENKPTVQGEIVSVLRRLTQEDVQLHGSRSNGCGRSRAWPSGQFSDTVGVVSAGISARVECSVAAMSIRIVGSEETGPAFNARFSAKGKIYRYRLIAGKWFRRFLWRYVLHYPFPLDEEAMKDAAARFVGVHDYSSFAASTGSEDDDQERNMMREDVQHGIETHR